MQLLVVGASGQVASSLAALNGSYGDITAVGRPEIDLAKPDTLRAAIDRVRPDVVASVGAYTAVDQAESEPEVARRLNALGPGALAAFCEEAGIPIIHISTDYVFDGEKADPYVESDPVAPTSVYGRTKLEGEELVARACARHVILRTAWVYSHEGKNFVRTMLRVARSRDSLNVVHDQIGCPTYAAELAEVIAKVAKRLTEDTDDDLYGVFHSSGSGSCSWKDFAQSIFQTSVELGGPSAQVTGIPSSDYPTPVTRPSNSRLDCSKLKRVYGVEQQDWRDGLAVCMKRIAESGFPAD